MQTPAEIAALWTAVFLGGVVSGFSGFAFSAAAGAILLHVFEPMAAVPLMMFCSIASQTMSLITVHRLIRWGELAPLLTGGTAGAAVSVPFMAAIEARSFRIGFGVCLARSPARSVSICFKVSWWRFRRWDSHVHRHRCLLK